MGPKGRELRVGIDLGGTAIKAGAVSLDGEVLERRSIPAELERGAQDLGVEPLLVLADLWRDVLVHVRVWPVFRRSLHIQHFNVVYRDIDFPLFGGGGEGSAHV